MAQSVNRFIGVTIKAILAIIDGILLCFSGISLLALGAFFATVPIFELKFAVHNTVYRIDTPHNKAGSMSITFIPYECKSNSNKQANISVLNIVARLKECFDFTMGTR